MKWISVKDRLPNDLEDVLVCHYKIKDRIYNAFYEKDSELFISTDDHNNPALNVTHWMPVPKTPEK